MRYGKTSLPFPLTIQLHTTYSNAFDPILVSDTFDLKLVHSVATKAGIGPENLNFHPSVKQICHFAMPRRIPNSQLK